jgi:hypothetical protein
MNSDKTARIYIPGPPILGGIWAEAHDDGAVLSPAFHNRRQFARCLAHQLRRTGALSALEGAMFNVLRKGPVRAALNMLLKPRGI